eukprot:jgi/Ulvmu1/893/UM100_0049.1
MLVNTQLRATSISCCAGSLSCQHGLVGALLLLLWINQGSCSLQDSPGMQLANVTTPQAFQTAARAGVEHIVLTQHLDMTASLTERDLQDRKALDRALLRVKRGTQSIAGRCSTPAPASFQLSEPLPPQACAILVREDFIDVPLRTERLWLDSLYVVMASNPGGDSAVLCLQTDGLLWVTNSVWQGAGSNCRAFDVDTADAGNPSLYIGDTVVTSFARGEAPGALLWPKATATLQNVTVKDMALMGSRPGTLEGAAIGMHSEAGLLLQDVTFAGSTWRGQAGHAREIGVSSAAPLAQVFSTPPVPYWMSPGGPHNASLPGFNSSSHARPFLDRDIVLRDIQQAQEAVVEEQLGPLPTAIAPMPAQQPATESRPNSTVALTPAPTPAPNPGPTPGPTPASGRSPQPAAAPGMSSTRNTTAQRPLGDEESSAGVAESADESGGGGDGVNGGLVAGVALAVAAAAAVCMAIVCFFVLRWNWGRLMRKSMRIHAAESMPAEGREAGGADGGQDGTGVDGLPLSPEDCKGKSAAGSAAGSAAEAGDAAS